MKCNFIETDNIAFNGKILEPRFGRKETVNNAQYFFNTLQCFGSESLWVEPLLTPSDRTLKTNNPFVAKYMVYQKI